MKLTKGIFSQQFDKTKTPFGLVNDQRRTDSIINSAVWFNIAGERLGSGDLSLKDMEKISSKIEPGEAFIVVGEGDAIWEIPDEANNDAPGFDFLAKKMLWSITNQGIIRVRDYVCSSDLGEVVRDGVKYNRISREAMLKSIGAAKKSSTTTQQAKVAVGGHQKLADKTLSFSRVAAKGTWIGGPTYITKP